MKLRIEVTHRLDENQFAQILAALRPPIVVSDEPLAVVTPPEIVEFEDALRAKNFDDAKTRHLRNALKVVMGKRACPPEFTRSVLRDQIASEGLPIPSGF